MYVCICFVAMLNIFFCCSVVFFYHVHYAFFCNLFCHRTRTSLNMSFLCVLLCICFFIQHWLEVQVKSGDLTKHVKPRRILRVSQVRRIRSLSFLYVFYSLVHLYAMEFRKTSNFNEIVHTFIQEPAQAHPGCGISSLH